MIRALAGAALLALSGCAGVATYNVRPFYEPTQQKMVCCEAVVTNGKDIASVVVDVAKTGDDYTIHFQESGVGATAPVTAQGAVVSDVATAVSNAAAAAIKLSPK
ncbi:hypothetical protein [Paraburkholderia rhynchosiae]|uniref:Lipoprotein n=1 Tax=Paraburkholderia rhynchosiae TaxID=487049 RepID=A0A2N7W9G5_9BURK|nr:hypothetical protein [Paraburkholderia rhynchosiae]PMS26019.1 hypothetical protein C0Z16_28200 [Paraburkholderia rhynchosiae]CAB3731259.1 hypothetical protein LMG27174_05820 [Paraburkholderia rhynchosiae]